MAETHAAASTERARELGDRRWRLLIEDHDRIVRRLIERHRGHLVKNTGDGALGTFDAPARAISCACEIRSAAQQLGLLLRLGLHTGEVEPIGGDIGGIAVHLCARVMAQAAPDEVLVTSTVKDLVAGSGIEFADHGEHALRGVPGTWPLFKVVE